MDQQATVHVLESVRALRNQLTTEGVMIDLREVVKKLDAVLTVLIVHATEPDVEPVRAIKQITASNGDEEHHDNLYALCEDNSLWRLGDEDDGWLQLPLIPLPESEAKNEPLSPR